MAKLSTYYAEQYALFECAFRSPEKQHVPEHSVQ